MRRSEVTSSIIRRGSTARPASPRPSNWPAAAVMLPTGPKERASGTSGPRTCICTSTASRSWRPDSSLPAEAGGPLSRRRKAGNDRANSHDPGGELVGRQEPADRGPLPDFRWPRGARGTVQGTKHVEQRRRLPRRVRDRPLAGDAGGRGGDRADRRQEPCLAQARSGLAVAGDRRRPPLEDARGAGVLRGPRAALAGGRRGARTAASNARSGDHRGGRQPGRAEFARGRDREHGRRPPGPFAGPPRRRHRSWRCLRPVARHPLAPRRGGPGAGPRPGGQQVPR